MLIAAAVHFALMTLSQFSVHSEPLSGIIPRLCAFSIFGTIGVCILSNFKRAKIAAMVASSAYIAAQIWAAKTICLSFGKGAALRYLASPSLVLILIAMILLASTLVLGNPRVPPAKRE